MFAKKSLGQHFLKDPRALRRIADAAHLAPTDVVLEIGPGEGALTALLLGRAKKVFAVEKDARFITYLQQRLAADIASGKLELIHQDILGFDPSKYYLLTTNYSLVANLPYYITGHFLRKFLQTEMQPQTMVLLLQKEVAQRIVAGDGKESILSISVKCYGTPRIVELVKAGAFFPPPKVDSAILTIENISKDFFADTSEEHFFALLKKGFAHPRKLLFRNLEVPASILLKCGIVKNARAENVTIEQWKLLACL